MMKQKMFYPMPHNRVINSPVNPGNIKKIKVLLNKGLSPIILSHPGLDQDEVIQDTAKNDDEFNLFEVNSEYLTYLSEYEIKNEHELELTVKHYFMKITHRNNDRYRLVIFVPQIHFMKKFPIFRSILTMASSYNAYLILGDTLEEFEYNLGISPNYINHTYSHGSVEFHTVNNKFHVIHLENPTDSQISKKLKGMLKDWAPQAKVESGVVNDIIKIGDESKVESQPRCSIRIMDMVIGAYRTRRIDEITLSGVRKVINDYKRL